MLNRVLQLLTARTRGFMNPVFRTPGGYSIPPSDTASRSVRELLRLHVEGTDYYLQGVLAALHAHPDVAALLPDSPRTWEPGDFQPPVITTTGGELAPDHEGNVGVRHHPPSLPAALSGTLNYESGEFGRLTLGPRRYVVRIWTFERGDHTYVRVLWPSDSGIRGLIRLAEGMSWEPGYEFAVHFFPASYPYTWLAEFVLNSNAAHDVLQGARLLESYIMEHDSIRRIAILAAALGLYTSTLTPSVTTQKRIAAALPAGLGVPLLLDDGTPVLLNDGTPVLIS